MRNVNVVVLLFLFLCVGIAHAADIDYNLQEAIDLAAEGDMIKGVIMMDDQVDAPALAAEWNHLGRAGIHRIVVEALRNKASETQGGVADYLETQQAQGNVSEFTPLWIANAFLVTAEAQVYRELAALPEIETLELELIARLIEPVESQSDSYRETDNVEEGLVMVGAPILWEMGYTGEGELISSCDTGVLRTHPALSAQWRGNQGHPGNECYYPWPAPSMNNDHGTHVTGTMCGRAGSDTIGVAPDASWIAVHSISGGGSTALGLQWLADPDGDPNTVDDVPIANNNSWGWVLPDGSPSKCDTGLNYMIDALEAAQCVVVFAAGNDGPDENTVGAPADRTTTPLNCFSVGNITHAGLANGSSSRGPTLCFGQYHIKPEVCAPGTNIRSSVFNNGYDAYTGTSMAAPHVAGGVALLHQAFPNSSANDLKAAIYLSAIDGGSIFGEDNSYGNGKMWLPGALEILENGWGQLQVSVFDNNNIPIPMHQVEILPNGLHPYTQQTGTAPSYPVPTGDLLVTATSAFGMKPDTMSVTIEAGDNQQALVFLHPLEDGVFTGSISGEGTETVTASLTFTHQENADFIVTGETDANGDFSIGLMAGIYNLSIVPSPPYVLQEIDGLVVGENQTVDLGVLSPPTASLLVVDDDGGDDYESYIVSSLNDLNLPHIVADLNQSADILENLDLFDYIIWMTGDQQVGTLTSQEQNALIAYLEMGKDLILTGQYIGNDIGGSSFFSDYLRAEHTADQVDAVFVEGVDGHEFGDGMLFVLIGGSSAGNQVSPSGVSALDGAETFLTYQDSDYDAATCYQDQTYGYEAIYCAFGLEAVNAPPQNTPREELIRQILLWEEYSIEFADFTAQAAPAGIELQWSIAEGANIVGYDVDRRNEATGQTKRLTDSPIFTTRFVDETAQPEQTYSYQIQVVEASGEVSSSGWITILYTPKLRAAHLEQNKPNPFNPQTQIMFSIPVTQHVEMAIFSITGQLIKTLVSGEMEAGDHSVTWNGANDTGESVSSGLYFYRLQAKESKFDQVRKMILMK
ncbi:MAG: hypothetical protein B6244_01025 [Candidatus Cloacimonetes bacterium 4572_55]|nr:MAG: hypothetical protein B6244_01025 [Candidatus Cloacimonetes bacterium 4572_55]